MAGLIVKSPYLKCGGGSSVSGYLRYIGTRERVEILQDDRPPTRKQEQLITKLTKDFPEAKELGEYSDYKDLFKPLQNRVFVKKAKDSEAAWVVLGWQTDGLTNIKDAATLQVVDAIMGSGMSSRLFNRLRDEQGLAYQVGSVFVPNVNSGLFAVFIGTNPKTALHSKNEMFKQIDILKKEFVADKELREAKDKILGNFILSQETNAEKAATIGWIEASGRGFDFIDKYPSIIESVTAGDIIRVANKYFNTNKAVITVVAPDEYLKQF